MPLTMDNEAATASREDSAHMSHLKRTVLEGGPAEVLQVLDELCRPGERVESEMLRELAVELVRTKGLGVAALSFDNEPWELEVTAPGDPRGDFLSLSRSESGLRCQVGWSRWIPLARKADIGNAARLITAIFQTSAIVGAREPMVNNMPGDPRLYRKIAASLKADISSGVLGPGERMPSITALSAKHGISRQTCGHAMQMLEADGLIHRQPGVGYVVSGGYGSSSP